MKRLLIVIVVCLFVGDAKAQEFCTVTPNPFVYQTGKLSLGMVSADTLVLYDVFKHIDGVTARVGGSVTIAQYDRLGAFIGAAAPTAEPSNIALVAGPSLDLDDVAKELIKSVLKIMPFSISPDAMEKIGQCGRLKLYGGYDMRAKGTIAGGGFGFGIF